jgi:iron complex transport system permease protein
MAVSALSLRRIKASTVVWACVILGIAAAVGIGLGPVDLTPRSVVLELVNRLPFVTVDSGLTERQAAVLWQLRVPRVVLGGLVGATLAMAGATYQGVFRNPLADPYLLGIAAGAGLGATLSIVAGVNSTWLLPLTAFAGGLLAVLVTYGLGTMGGGGLRTTGTLILAGVAVASFFTAAQTLAQQLASDTIREVFAWILGRLSTVGWTEVLTLTPFVLVSGAVMLLHGRHLDVLAVGEAEASTLGLPVERVRITLVVAATLATAAAVSVSGLIGFVGIVVPHAVRRIVGTSYRAVLPLSIIGGAVFLVIADVIARTIIAPSELPIGVVTAFVGAPFFAVVLRRTRKGLV